MCVYARVHIFVCKKWRGLQSLGEGWVFILLPLPSIDPCNGEFYKGKCLKYSLDVGNVFILEQALLSFLYNLLVYHTNIVGG